MKLESAYRRAMDSVRPVPERREAMLQAILNHGNKPAARRWALTAVPAAAVAVLALALAWGGGALAPGKTAAPDVVTQAAPSPPVPSPLSTLKPGAVQWLPNVTLASPDVANNLPDKLVLVRSELMDLSEDDVKDAETTLEGQGWDNVKLQRTGEGYYRLTAHRAAAQEATSPEDRTKTHEDFRQIAKVFEEIAGKHSIRLSGERPKAYAGLRLTLEPQSDVLGFGSVGSETEVNVESDITFWRDEQLGSAVNALSPQEALKNAFYVLGGHPALDADAAMQVSSLNFVCVSGVPCYQFPVQTANGTRYGYALAVDQKDLDAIPELAATYQRFLNGETMQIDVILQSPTGFVLSPQEIKVVAQSLPNLMLSDHTNQPDGLPWMVPLLRTTPIELTDEQLQAVAQRLRDKGWKNIAVQKHGDGSYTIRTDGDTSSQPALSDDENHEQARQFMQDSGLAELLRQQGMPVALQPSDGSGTALYRGLDHGYSTPGFVRLNLERGMAVDECLIYAVRSQWLGEQPRLALEQAAAQALYFPTEGDRVQPDTALEAGSVRLAYADVLPIYEFHAPIPGTKGMVTAYAPAVDEAALQANEELRQTLERFRTGQLAITGYAGPSQRLPYLKVFPPEGELIVELDDEIAAHMEALFREDWNTIITAAQSSPKYTAEERFYSDTNVWVFWQHLEDQYGASDHGYRILRNELGERALAHDSRADSPIATELCDYLLGVVNGLNTGFSYVDSSDVRDITGARLTMKGGHAVELTDKAKLRQLEKSIQEAQPLGYRPQTYEQAARVELTLAKGPTVTVMLDGLNDFFWLGSGCFYDYGPDPNGRDSMDATTPNGTGELLALFGLQGWE